MAGNYTVSTARYQPFTYEEMLAPVLLADTQHKAIEEQFGELSNQAGAIGSLINEQTDPVAAQRYQQFSNNLQQQAEALASQGLTPTIRTDLINSRTNYNEQIAPIQTAYNRRLQLIDEQRGAALKDPTIRFSTNASNLSVDELLANPALSYNNYSGEQLTKAVSQQTSQFAKQLLQENSPWRVRMQGMFGPSEFERILNYGFSPQQIQRVIENDPKASQILMGIRDSAVQSTGVQNWGDQQAYQDAIAYADQGLWHGIGASQIDKADNPDYQFYLQDALANRRAQRANDDELSGYRANYSTTNYYDVNKNNKPLSDASRNIFGNNWERGEYDKTALTKYFGVDGSTNPVAIYDTIQEIEEKYKNKQQVLIDNAKPEVPRQLQRPGSSASNSVWNALASNTPSNAVSSSERRQAIKQQIEEEKAVEYAQLGLSPDQALSSKEIDALRAIGITPESNYEDVIGKITNEVTKQSTRQTGYSITLTKNDPIINLLQDSVAKTLSQTTNGEIPWLTPLDNNFEPKSNKVVRDESRFWRSDYGEGFNKVIGENGENLQLLEWMPKAGLTILTKSGERYAINPENLGNEIGGQNGVLGEMPLIGRNGRIIGSVPFQEYVNMLIDAGEGDKANETIVNMLNNLTPMITHGRNYIQGNTASDIGLDLN